MGEDVHVRYALNFAAATVKRNVTVPVVVQLLHGITAVNEGGD